eukprot:scaffold266722_cov20-Tisochrysis_lutea.AAC.1
MRQQEPPLLPSTAVQNHVQATAYAQESRMGPHPLTFGNTCKPWRMCKGFGIQNSEFASGMPLDATRSDAARCTSPEEDRSVVGCLFAVLSVRSCYTLKALSGKIARAEEGMHKESARADLRKGVHSVATERLGKDRCQCLFETNSEGKQAASCNVRLHYVE